MLADPSPPDRLPPARSPAEPPSRWPRFRALLIAVALLVECTSALPDRRLHRRHLQRPEVQRVVNGADRLLGALHASPGPRALARALRVGSDRLVSARAFVLRPFAPLLHYTATSQQWGLFMLGTRECFRVHVDANAARTGWVELYRAPGQGQAWLERLMRYRRLRGIYNPRAHGGPNPQYPGFVRELARRVFARDPRYIALRVRMERLRIGEPGRAPESSGFEHELLVSRAELAP